MRLGCRTWLLLFTASFACTNVVSHGYGIVGFMFYRLQYKLSTIMYGHLISTWFVCNFFAQLFVVPFLRHATNSHIREGSNQM